MQASRELNRLIEIMAALRDPKTGCPWDLEQDFSSIRHYTIEEAYEVADAIERADYDDLREELGDLLLQPIYHAQMASERGLFDIGDVIHAITEKLIRRHPHVFGDDATKDATGAKESWEAAKVKERSQKAERHAKQPSVLDDVPRPLPALVRAEKLAKRAAGVGFDWSKWQDVAAKIREELYEVEDAVSQDASEDHIHEEIGDLLFATANLARHLGVDPEASLRDANLKFARRFAYVETRAAQDGISLSAEEFKRLEAYWNEIRERDKSAHIYGHKASGKS